MRVLVLGAYGFIGSEIARTLQRSGHDVVGFGRSAHFGRQRPPSICWVTGDLHNMTEAAHWMPLLDGIGAVVNSSGALQDGFRDKLKLSQGRSIAALVEACERTGIERFVQISAPGAHSDASTEFMRSKAVADDRLRCSALDWTILRPGLVIGRNAYGGTALIRMLAAFPFVVPAVHGDCLVQTVAMDELVAMTIAAVDGHLPHAIDADLVEPEPHRLIDVILAHRSWLGFPAPLAIVDIPPVLARPIAWLADVCGFLGWRSPLCSTALRLINEDVLGDAKTAGRVFSGLHATLGRMSAGAQDRLQARLGLLLPIVVAALAGLWLGSGTLGFIRTEDAAALLIQGGIETQSARMLVLGGSLADIALGIAILFRPWARRAALSMVALTIAYLVGGSIFRPDLWVDPLAPLLKTIPAMALALVLCAILEER